MNILLARVLSPLVLITMATAAQAQVQREPYNYPHMWGDGWGWGSMMIFGPLMMILFIALIVVIVVLAVRWLGGTGPAARAGRTPLDILKERFARGEIDKAEFEERRRALGE